MKNKLKNKKVITSRELVRLLEVNGYILDRTRGDHRIYRNGENSVSINMRNLNRMVALRLIKENRLLDC